MPAATYDDGPVKSCYDIPDDIPGEIDWSGYALAPNIIQHGWFSIDFSEDVRQVDVELTEDGEEAGIQLAVLVSNKNGQTNLFLWPDTTHLYAPLIDDEAAKIKKYAVCKVHPYPPGEEPSEPPTTEPPTEEPPTEEPPTEEPPTEEPTEEPPTEEPSETPSEEPSATPSETPEPELPDTGSSPTVLIGAGFVLLVAGALALRQRFVKP